MERDILMTIIIPVYNAEKYLQMCIDCLLEQTMKNSMEFIFINDCSQDSSYKILVDNHNKFPEFIRVVNCKKKMRQGGARNMGIQKAKGKYVGFVDADDLVAKSMYEDLYIAAEKSNADVAMSNYKEIDENTQWSDVCGVKESSDLDVYLEKWSDVELDDQGRMEFMCRSKAGMVCGLWRKEFIIENSFYFPENVAYEDNYWGTVVFSKIQRIVLLKQIHYFYRQHNSSTTKGMNELHQFDRIKVENMLDHYMKKNNMCDRYKDALEYIYSVRYVLNSIGIFYFMFDKPNKQLIYRLIKELKCKYPKWRRNPYYKTMIPCKQKIVNWIIVYLPHLYINAYKPTLKLLVNLKFQIMGGKR